LHVRTSSPSNRRLGRTRAGLSVALALLSLGAAGQTITASKSVTLSATLSAQCRVASASSGAITLTFPSYTAFGGAVTAPAQTINFECTRGLGSTPTFAWDAGGGTTAGDGVLAGLRYSLTATNGTRTNGVAPVLGTPGDVGTPDTYPVNVGGSMPAGQAGAGASGTYTATRTLTVTF
jgi:hypothetical protein